MWVSVPTRRLEHSKDTGTPAQSRTRTHGQRQPCGLRGSSWQEEETRESALGPADFTGRLPRGHGDNGAELEGGDVCTRLTRLTPALLCRREKWSHMTQEERADSLRFNENITFGQLG